MASLDRPKLRPLSAQWIERWGQTYAELQDPLRGFTDPVRIPIERYQWVVRHFDGRTALSDIQVRVTRETGQWISSAELERVVAQLDRAMVLDGPTFAAFHEAYRRERVRTPAHAGRSYLGIERALRAQLGAFSVHAEGSGLPRDGAATRAERLRGILSPHIDFDRGGPVYTWSYKELIERSDADTFVILGVAHQHCRHRFALTSKDFETPLGLAPTDCSYVDRVAALAGTHLFDDELAHRPEHSIEFQVIFLQYLLGGRRAFSIVPILVGSSNDLMQAGIDPIEAPEVRQFVEALRAAESASGKRVAYIGGIDLCHVGPEFGDPELLDPATLDTVRGFDAAMLDRAAAGDPAGWFGTAAHLGNRWRVCGLAATYTMLHAMGPAQGRLLRYDQAVNPERTCCVSFASLAFDAAHANGTGTAAETEVRHRV
jgi:MEMO1 family protein